MSTPIVTTVGEMQSLAERLRLGGHRLALVPTMGALHAGHLALVHEARKRADAVIVSVFVNPTQFGDGEDLDRYPRRLETDVGAIVGSGGVRCIFAPTVTEMYPYGSAPESGQTWVQIDKLDAHLCGRHRPGHFRGVATVVAKLLNACKPHVAVFGLKDAQQYVILRRMVRDLLVDVDVVGVPTVREADGLAMSSRNEYLSPAERSQALVLAEAVFNAADAVAKGEQHVQAIVQAMQETIGRAPLARLQYAEVVDAENLQPVELLAEGSEVLVAVAVYFGNTRLIDSTFVRVP